MTSLHPRRDKIIIVGFIVFTVIGAIIAGYAEWHRVRVSEQTVNIVMSSPARHREIVREAGRQFKAELEKNPVSRITSRSTEAEILQLYGCKVKECEELRAENERFRAGQVLYTAR